MTALLKKAKFWASGCQKNLTPRILKLSFGGWRSLKLESKKNLTVLVRSGRVYIKGLGGRNSRMQFFCLFLLPFFSLRDPQALLVLLCALEVWHCFSSENQSTWRSAFFQQPLGCSTVLVAALLEPRQLSEEMKRRRGKKSAFCDDGLI